jgi:hypothetical protein
MGLVKWLAIPHQVGTDQDRGRRTEYIKAPEQSASADFPTGDNRARVRQPIQGKAAPSQLICPDNAYRGVSLSNFDHSGYTLWKHPIVGMYDFAILTYRRDLLNCNVMILHPADELVIIMNTNPPVLLGKRLCNLERAVPTAIIHNDIFPVLVSLG